MKSQAMKSSQSKTSKTHSNYWQLPEVEKGPLTSENVVMTNLSIGMTLALAKSFGTQSKYG